MELHVLNDSFEKDTVVDRFESLIWTERFSSYGDFELTLHAADPFISLFPRGTHLMMNKSQRVMTVENLVNKVSDDGKAMLSVTGRSIESVLLERNARQNMSGSTANPKWSIAGMTPAAVARKVFQDICVTGILSVGDKIPYYTSGTTYPTSTIPEPTDTPTIDIPPDASVYGVIKDICDQFNLGFRLYRDLWNTNVYFEIYSGNDRSASQIVYDPVIFSESLDTLTNVSTLLSSETYKTVAYVIAPNGSRMVYAPGIDSSVSGFDRRVLTVMADDITLAAGASLDTALEQRGQLELSKNRQVTALDGEIPKSSSFIYDVHYNLGDLIDERSADGTTNRMRVTEQIFVDDAEGERSYPTLIFEQIILPGSWLDPAFASTWNAYGISNPTKKWNDL